MYRGEEKERDASVAVIPKLFAAALGASDYGAINKRRVHRSPQDSVTR